MPLQQAWLAKARPQILAARVAAVLGREVAKGCQREISTHPVALEPAYCPLAGEIPAVGSEEPPWVLQDPFPADQLRRAQIWVSPEQPCDWDRSERLLKQLSRTTHRVILELLGNQEQIHFFLGCHQEDVPVVHAAFMSQFERCRLLQLRGNPLAAIPAHTWDGLVFRDYYPPPPYSHLLTRPEELRLSPYGTIMTVLGNINPPTLGLCQVLFQGVAPGHNWHHNVQRLLDLEFTVKLMSPWQAAQRYSQQAPSGDLRHMAMDAESKAHSDKPFLAAALRLAVIGASAQAEDILRALGIFGNLLQHGGRPLEWLSTEDYRPHLDADQLRQMLIMGHAYRPGFLVNSCELTSLAHIPAVAVAEDRPAPIDILETLPADPSLAEGTPIGTCEVAGEERSVCIPPSVRRRHTHIIGATDHGKSTCMEHMILHDIECEHGTAVIDPHGSLVEELLCLLPSRHVDRVIYFNPGNRDWIPIWNPLRCGVGQFPDRLSDDILLSIRRSVTDWGDRLAHALRQAIRATIGLPDGTLFDVYRMLTKDTEEGEQLRRRALEVTGHRITQTFFESEFRKYSHSELTSPRHKLSHFLNADTICHMLSQPESRFNFREIMDSGKILLVDLSTVGGDAGDILGAFMLSLLHLAALSRSDTKPSACLPFHIYCDEAYRFLTPAIEKLFTETRKFKVSLTLAHHNLGQLNSAQVHAVSGVGSTIVFRVDGTDATYLKKNLLGRVRIEDLSGLEKFQAIARIGNQIVRLQTREARKIHEPNNRDLIIQQSRQRYCRPLAEMQRVLSAGLKNPRTREATP